jgi:N-acetylmuramoyl-L-alanine amidase/Papain family cysteine protease
MPAWKGIIGKGFRPDDFRQYVGTLAFTDWRPQFIVVHNTSSPRLSQWHSTPGEQRMRNLESYYRDQLHWSAGPHLFVADDLIWVFTPLTTSGVHSPSWNGISWGVEIVGEFDQEPFGGAIKANAVDALAILHQWRGLDPQMLRFHKEDRLTTHRSCPGRNVDKMDLILAIENRIASALPGEHPGAAPATPLPLQTAYATTLPRASAPVPGAAPQQSFFGWRPDIPDHRDYPYGAMRLGLERPVALPKSIDLRPNISPVFDQRNLQSCTACAIATAIAFNEKKQYSANFDGSRLFVYFNARLLEDDIADDAGAYIRDGIKAVATNGICAETDWPYDVSKFASQPPAQCYQGALQNRAISYYRLDNRNLDELRACLAAGFPFMFGFAVYPSFDTADSNRGIVPMPGDEPLKGGHSVLAVGYNDDTQLFTVQNSWGPNRGDRGYFYMPYQYLTSTLSDDFWTIRSVSSPAAGQGAPAGGQQGVNGNQGLPFTAPGTGPAAAPGVLTGDGSFAFHAEISGNDIEVRGVISTWFGGPDDPEDSGTTASGVSTRDNPNILGCALPMDGFHHRATDGSPLPRLPWNTPVRVKNVKSGIEQTFPLIDLGPSKFANSHAAIDLTEAAFTLLGGEPSDGVMHVDYVIPDGARFVPAHVVSSVSIGQSTSEDLTSDNLASIKLDDHGDSHDIPKPILKAFIESPNFNSRNGTKIDMVVMHFTDGPTAQGAINRFLNPASQVSAHYIIDRNGDIYQMVRDSDRAWHAKAANSRSIGIEHVAVAGQNMAPLQETSSVALVSWLMASYKIDKARIVGHRFAPGNDGTTDCPDHLFGAPTLQAIQDWVRAHF